MPTLPGVDLPNPPVLPGTQPGANAGSPDVPSWWNDQTVIMARVFAMAAYDPQAAVELWAAWKRLTGH